MKKHAIAVYKEPTFPKERRPMMQFHNPGFGKVKMSRTKLIDILKKNKDTHAREFEEALRGYQRTFLERAKALVEVVQDSINREERATYVESFGLEAPTSYVKDYEKVISMLEHHEAESVELSTQEFSAYVHDEWEWKGYHASTVANYSGPQGPTGPAGPTGPVGPRYRAVHVQKLT